MRAVSEVAGALRRGCGLRGPPAGRWAGLRRPEEGGFRALRGVRPRPPAPPAVAADAGARLRAGGLGYGDLKKGLFEHFWAFFAPARARRAELLANPDYVDQVLRDGAARARSVAAGVIRRARKAAGLE